MGQELNWTSLNSFSKAHSFRQGQQSRHCNQELKYLPDAAIPVLFRSYQQNQLPHENLEENLLLSPPLVEAFYILAKQVKLLRKNAHALSRIDSLTEQVTRPLECYCKAVLFEPLSDGAGFQINSSSQPLSININTISSLLKEISKTAPKDLIGKTLGQAILVFLCHESCHISQGIRTLSTVKRMKMVNEEMGRTRMGEIDLRSDFIAVHTLAFHFALCHGEFPNQKTYIKYFYKIWCNVCKKMISSFPNIERKDKQQRIFGYLLMANLVEDSYVNNRPLAFNAELWVEWNNDLDTFSIYSNGQPLISGAQVNPDLMRQILDAVTQGKLKEASQFIAELWLSLPRR